MKKTVLGILLSVLLLTLAGCSSKNTDNFSTWTEDAEAIKELQSYVENVTNENSEDFIPVEDRIAAFDLDGTLFCETFSIYGEWLMFADRVFNDPTYEAPEDVYEVAEIVAEAAESRVIPDGLEEAEIKAQAKAFAGMSLEEYMAFAKEFMKTDAEGYNNLKRGEAFYKPMLEVVTYLQENDFTVYICSGTNRFTVRALIDGVIDIPERQVIGTDFTMKATGQGNKGDMHYSISADDEVLMGDELIIKNVKTSKVFQLEQELGQKPVLVFGNSTGDIPMALYSDSENEYETEVFFLMCDDLEREHGNEEKAESIRKACEEHEWNTISMRDDWVTIYGDDVTITD